MSGIRSILNRALSALRVARIMPGLTMESDQPGTPAGGGLPETGLPVFIFGQGRSGSTLILRILNTVPGVRICGENEKALDHIRRLYLCYEQSRRRMINPFYALAWAPPCELSELADHCRRFISAIYNPGGQFRVWGFKEIRYGGKEYQELSDDLAFLLFLFPSARFVFNTRMTADTVRSEWWSQKPDESTKLLERSRNNFEQYVAANPKRSFLLPYESLKPGSPTLRELFAFIGVQHLPEYEKPLEIVLR